MLFLSTGFFGWSGTASLARANVAAVQQVKGGRGVGVEDDAVAVTVDAVFPQPEMFDVVGRVLQEGRGLTVHTEVTGGLGGHHDDRYLPQFLWASVLRAS